MIRQIAPQFFSTDIPGTLAYYKTSLASSVWGRGSIRRSTPSWRAISRIHFRCAEPPWGQSAQVRGRTGGRIPLGRGGRRASCRVRSQGRGIYTGTWQHTMGLARVRGEGLRRPSADFWLELNRTVGWSLVVAWLVLKMPVSVPFEFRICKFEIFLTFYCHTC